MLGVADIMTAYPLRVTRDTPLPECLRRMRETRYRHLPVVADGGRAVGVLHDLDLLTPELVDRVDLTAGSVSRPPELVVHPEDRLDDVIDAMLDGSHCAAVVVDGMDVLVGIVTSHDVVRLAPRVLDPTTTALAAALEPLHRIDRLSPASVAYATMRAHRVRHLVVLTDALLYGVVSLFDLVDAGVLQGADPRVDATLRSLQVDHATTNTTLRTAALLMADWQIGCLPIVDDVGRVIASLGRRDILRAMRAAQEGRPLHAPEVACRALHAGNAAQPGG